MRIMEKKLLVATRNIKKQKELQELLNGSGWQVLALRDFPHCPDVEEDGDTFLENAAKKALAASEHSGLLALADDSGLEVNALENRPGVRSARYARGEGSTDQENLNQVLYEMKDVPDDQREARFVCAAVLAKDNEVVFETLEHVSGVLTRAERGDGGFGYDPIFFYPPFNKTFAEVPAEEKHKVSHRGKALRDVVMFLSDYQE